MNFQIDACIVVTLTSGSRPDPKHSMNAATATAAPGPDRKPNIAGVAKTLSQSVWSGTASGKRSCSSLIIRFAIWPTPHKSRRPPERVVREGQPGEVGFMIAWLEPRTSSRRRCCASIRRSRTVSRSPPRAPLSLAMLVLVESLSPEQRAALLLHDVFDYGYLEIIGKSEDSVRQLASRARRHVEERREGWVRFQTSREQREELAQRFLAAAPQGDLAGLEALPAHDWS